MKTYDIRMNLECDGFTGYIKFRMHSNFRPILQLNKHLDCVVDSIYETDCNFKSFDNPEFFDVLLRDKNGDTLSFSDDVDNLSDYVTDVILLEIKER